MSEVATNPDLFDQRIDRLDTGREDRPLNGLFERLSAQGVAISSMRNKANRLEELFVSLVEKNLKAPVQGSNAT